MNIDIVVAIVESGGANFASIKAALTKIGVAAVVTQDPERIKQASHVILPGVGTAGYAMELLREKALIAVIRDLKQPLLGICLGMQILCEYSEEEQTPGLGIFPMRVKKINHTAVVVPHMGWNNLSWIAPEHDALLSGIKDSDDFYFVHSYAVELKQPFVQAICDYSEPFAAVIQQDNFYGVQFHPEKSGVVGERMLRNFLSIPVAKEE